MKYILEVIAFNIESCTTIEKAGAHRIELCDNPGEGGTTPSYGFIKQARENVSIDLFPIIRPRGGDFLYSDLEFEIMRRDVQLCKELHCDGVVIGLLKKDGRIDIERTSKLVEIAYPLEVTFHRAFDRVRDAAQALEDVVQTGCTRILTSGLHPTVMEGKEVLQQLVQQAHGRITIMPGSGLRAANIETIAQQTGATEFHTSARAAVGSSMEYSNPAMNESLQYMVADKKEIEACLQVLRKTS
ncbi:MAG: copper homeostasis protein CutC [Chitinophagaceae bacterium]